LVGIQSDVIFQIALRLHLKMRRGLLLHRFTNNVEKRILQHNQGADIKCYTFKRRPVELVYAEGFQDFKMAIACEKQVKGWSRKKKEALIAGNWDQLKELSKCDNATSHLNHRKLGK
jgi:putative endonuclease